MEFIFDYSTPLVCTAIHNGHKLSMEIADNLGITDEECLREEDPFTDFFTEFCPNRVIASYSRFQTDLNRTRDRAFYQNPQDAWGLPVRLTPPPSSHKEQSLKIYDDFYSEIKLHFDKMVQEHKKFLVMDIHSYNHHRQGPGKPFDDPEHNPEIIIGTSNMPKEWHHIPKALKTNFEEYNFYGRILDARINVKFPGGNFPRWIHRNYPNNACCIALEFKKIFMDEWSGELDIQIQAELKKALQFAVKNTLPLIKV